MKAETTTRTINQPKEIVTRLLQERVRGQTNERADQPKGKFQRKRDEGRNNSDATRTNNQPKEMARRLLQERVRGQTSKNDRAD
jgi:hypothetical protein